MIVAGVVWLLGVVCALAMFLFANHGATSFEARYTSVEIIWASLFWPLVVLVLAAFIVLAKVKAARS